MPQTPEHPIEKPGTEETLEFLKRQEVRTMAKDVALLREEEATKEREKIASMKPEAATPLKEPLNEPIKEPLKEPLKEPEPKAPSLMPAPPSSRFAGLRLASLKLRRSGRASHFDKVFIRVALILGATFVLVNVVAFAVWNIKKGGAPINEPIPTPIPLQELIEPEGSSDIRPEDSVPREPERPISLLSIERTKIIEIQQPDQIVTSLAQFFQQNSEPGFTRILFKHALENRFLTLSQVLQGANFILAPELGQSDALFLFVSEQFKRIGLAASLKDVQLAPRALRAQEKTFEQDATPILSVVGRKGQGYTTFFRTASHKGIPIRFQTLSVRDFGVVYAIMKDTLLVTTSLESMRATLDLLLETK